MKLRIKQFISKAIRQREKLINSNESKKPESEMREYTSKLKRHLAQVDFSEKGIMRFFLLFSHEIRSILVDKKKDTKTIREFYELLEFCEKK